MANIRAYKLAEELGIDRSEFVDVAGTHGVELKSAMASLNEATVELLREKIAGTAPKKREMDERRLESKGGMTVVRRRRKKAPEPEPEPVVEAPPIEEVAAVAAAEVVAAEVGAPTSEVMAGADAAASPTTPATPGSPDSTSAATPAGTGKTASPAKPGSPAAPRDGRTAPGTPESPDRKGKQRKRVREVVNLQEQEQFAKQITSRGSGQRRVVTTAPRSAVNPRARRRDKLSPKPTSASIEASKTRQVKVSGDISIGELSKQSGLKAPAIQGKLMALGIMVSVNQRIDFETVQKISGEMGFEAADVGFKEETFLETTPGEVNEGTVEASENLKLRPPIITVMGHVDHGKTSLLDAIRKTQVTEGEAGGITQHVGAYQVTANGHDLTFIDTPGHAAFTAMRARGAAVTDLVVLVIAATEGVMPQTVEAIEHAQAAGCPILVAVNKCDLPEADPEKARQRLTEHNLVPEDFGGDVICVNVSAKTGDGIDQLLEMLALQAEVLELRADSTRRASGVVLEAQLDKGRGPVATIIIQNGTLKKGDSIVVGTTWGRVRQMRDDNGANIREAGPSTPVQITGLSDVPSAGAAFHAVESDRVAKQIIDHREDQLRGKTSSPKPRLTLDEFYAQSSSEGPKELSVVLKADVQGSCEAARDALEKLSTDEVKLRVISSGVGAIVENDINLASASGTIVLGFNVRPDPPARKLSDSANIEIRTYTIIMQMLDDVKAAMAGLLPAIVTENMLGRAEIRETFTIPKIGTIAGSLILEGKFIRNAHCRVVRDGIQVYTGTVGSLRRFKDDVKEVINGMECGIGVATYNDVKVGDVIEAFELSEKPAVL
ncbi:MAG TPA: translation initiation factor IF-2 [Myxococcales bacterium]|nr:translation initiation factor IF-2 [Myxococcales bacterium]HIK83878.1 translation initiation factor IF-2 [Myxococcales bacterium]